MIHQIKRISVNIILTIRNVRIRQLIQQPVLFLVPLVILYVIAAIGFAIVWYGFDSSKPIVKRSLQFFPFPAAVIDGGLIWSSQLDRQVGFVVQFSEKTGQSQVVLEQAPGKIFDRLVENKLVEKAAAKGGVRVTLAEVNEAYKQLAEKHGGEAEVAKVLANLYGMTPADFRQLIGAELVKQQVRGELLVNVKVRHILVKDEKRAREVFEKARAGANFDDLAKEFSEDKESREKGGDLGFIHRGQVNDKLENAAFGTKVGELHGDIVKSDLGFHVIRVDDRRGSVDKTYEQWFEEVKSKTRVIRLVKV